MSAENNEALRQLRSEMATARVVFMREMAGLSMGLPDEPSELSSAMGDIERRYSKRIEEAKQRYRDAKQITH